VGGGIFRQLGNQIPEHNVVFIKIISLRGVTEDRAFAKWMEETDPAAEPLRSLRSMQSLPAKKFTVGEQSLKMS
jgi:hypothetical protein